MLLLHSPVSRRCLNWRVQSDRVAPLAILRFEVIRWTSMPDLETFRKALHKASQLWVISSDSGAAWTPGHLEQVQKLVNARKGLFIWADNEPYGIALRACCSSSFFFVY